MKNLKSKMLVGGSVAAIGLSLAGAGVASASTMSNHQDNLVNKISTKFNLNKAEVQKVFEEEHAAREAERLTEMKTRLDQAVKDNKITQAQEDQIIAKIKEMQTFRDSLKDKTPDERHDAMQAKMEELKKWASDNNIPTEYLMGGMGRGHGKGGRHGMMGDAR